MKDTKQQKIAELGLFRDCAPRDVRWIAAHADMVTVGPRSELAIAGSHIREFMVIVDGVASSGDVVFGPGSCFGDREDGTHARTIEAMTDTKVLVFGLREFRGLLLRVPSIAEKIRSSAAGVQSPADQPRRSAARLPSRVHPTRPSAA